MFYKRYQIILMVFCNLLMKYGYRKLRMRKNSEVKPRKNLGNDTLDYWRTWHNFDYMTNKFEGLF